MELRTVEIAESILDALGEPVLVLDNTLRAVMANPAFCRALQIPAGSLKGKKVNEFVSGKNGSRQLIFWNPWLQQTVTWKARRWYVRCPIAGGLFCR
jgi:PAS domain-containing protein